MSSDPVSHIHKELFPPGDCSSASLNILILCAISMQQDKWCDGRVGLCCLCSSRLSCGGQRLLPDTASGLNAHQIIDHFPPAKNIIVLGQWEGKGLDSQPSGKCCLQGNRSHTSKVEQRQAAIFVNSCPAFDQQSRWLIRMYILNNLPQSWPMLTCL